MSAIPGMKAPDFGGMTTGPNGHKDMALRDFTSNNNWCLLFFYPMDFGYISPSELLALNSIKEDLDKLNCNLVGCSPGTPALFFRKFLSLAPEDGGVRGLSFPVLEDVNGDIAKKFDLECAEVEAGFFLIDNEGIIRMTYSPMMENSIIFFLFFF